MDAPGIRDDYYLNLLDWSSQNTLAVALDKVVYLWDATSSEITELMDLPEEGDYITSVSWMADGNVIAVGKPNMMTHPPPFSHSIPAQAKH